MNGSKASMPCYIKKRNLPEKRSVLEMKGNVANRKGKRSEIFVKTSELTELTKAYSPAANNAALLMNIRVSCTTKKKTVAITP